jgi:uncharacterized lipoprotein YddW (UPF0748 family)
MRILAALLLAPIALGAQSAPDTVRPPEIMREFRGLWVATVNNIDWPSRSDLPRDEQQRELVAILDRAAALRMNAIVFQVRPEADALYASKIEPWSRYLTGEQGKAPVPAWDPLAFAVDEAHKRGLELHAWFNPYRVSFNRERPNSRSHISRRRPDLVVRYGQYLWMNPAIPEVRQLMIRVITDVVRRYDVDGVHIDDYFYPYPEARSGQRLEFPDARSFAAYRRSGGQLDRSDWRRRNVDNLVRDFYMAVKREKPWVKVGISPFGIWRPGYPAGTTAGLDQHEELYADARKWLREGWLDYLAPQLYWPIQPADQSYPVLLKWWVDESVKGRHVWPGLALYKLPITGARHMSADEIVAQIGLTRQQQAATGHIHFNAKVLMDNVDGIADRLAAAYAEPAIMPPSPWLDTTPPGKPSARIVVDSTLGHVLARFAPRDGQFVWQWIVQSRTDGSWRTTILPGSARSHILKDEEARADFVAVTALDRNGNPSATLVVPRN